MVAIVEETAYPLPTIQAVYDPVLLNDWHAIAKTTDLKPGTLRSARLLGENLVLWRGQDGQVFAWDDRCPHRSVRLSNGSVISNTVRCPYHGLVYNSEGKCIQVPAHPDYVPPKQACVKTYLVQERYGLIFVCLGKPQSDIVVFPEWDNANYFFCLTGPHHCRSNGYRAIENFLDVAHFSFIHANILGDPDKPVVEDYEVSIEADGVRFRDIRYWQPDAYGTGEGATVTYNYWAPRPLTAYLSKDAVNGQRLTIIYFVAPVAEEEMVGWMILASNYTGKSQEAELAAFQETVFAQDVGNLESHNPQKLPLDATTEFHLPFDRGSLAYRKWLKQLGVTFGILS